MKIKRVDWGFFRIALERVVKNLPVLYYDFILKFICGLYSYTLFVLRWPLNKYGYYPSIAMVYLPRILTVERNRIFENEIHTVWSKLSVTFCGIVLETSMKLQKSNMYSKQFVLMFNSQTSWILEAEWNTDLCHRARSCNFSHSSVCSLFDYQSSVIDSWQCESYYNTQIGCMWFELWKTLLWSSYSNVLWSERQTR